MLAPLTIAAIALIVGELAVFGYEVVSWKGAADYALFKRKCSVCHEIERPQNYAKSPAEWRATVARRLPDGEPTKTTKVERERIAELLIRRRSADGETLYRYRCARCHQRSWLAPFLRLDRETLTLLIREHTRQKNYAIQVWEGDEIAAYVAQTLARPAANEHGFSPRDHLLYQRACGACHTTRFIRRTMCREAAWRSDPAGLVKRMREKSPVLFTDGEASLLANYAKRICETGNPIP